VYTKQSTHMPTLNALLSDSSLYDAQHAQFVKMLPSAKSRPRRLSLPAPASAEALTWP
jgi:hypothetical protein